MAKIEWHDVESSNIARVGIEYDDKALKVELYVTFKSGTQYVYHGVPADTAQGLLDADSVGKYFNENVKGAYNFNKLSG